MVFKRFGVIVFLRTIVLCVSAFILIYLLTRTSFIATPFIVALIIVAQMYSLVHYVQKTNRDIARFFDSIKYSDFSQSFRSTVKGSSFEELNNAFSEVIDEFRKTRAEKEEHYRYLQIVVQHIGIGLLAFTQDGSALLSSFCSPGSSSVAFSGMIAPIRTGGDATDGRIGAGAPGTLPEPHHHCRPASGVAGG